MQRRHRGRKEVKRGAEERRWRSCDNRRWGLVGRSCGEEVLESSPASCEGLTLRNKEILAE